MSARRARWLVRAGLGIALGLTVLVYWPGLDGPFVFDDYPSFVDASRVQMTSLDRDAVVRALYTSNRDRPDRGLAHLSFALNHYFAGGAFVPGQVKAVNLSIHLLVGMVLFALARRLARRHGPESLPPWQHDALAALVAAVWLLHPLALTSVLYAVQRMTSLSALCVLVGVLLYVIGRDRLDRGARGGGPLMLCGVLGGTAMGVFFKENAVLLPALALLVEIAFYTRARVDRFGRRLLLALHGLTVLVPALALIALLVLRFDIVESTYTSRDFTPLERLLTQSRVLFHYLEMVVFPRLSVLGLFHDDIAISRGLLSPPSTLAAVLGWLAILVACGFGLLRGWGWAFGMAWFLVGHSIESSLIGLEMAHEHRNYLPVAGLLVGFALSGRTVLARVGVRRRALVAAGVPVFALLAFLTHTRADIWRSEASLMEFTATVHPQSYRAATNQVLLRVVNGYPLEDIYGGWIRAAKLTDADHTALIESLKLISYASGRMPPLEDGQSCHPPGTVPDRMPRARECMRELLDTLLAEMDRRALEAPIPSTTVLAYEHLGTCVLNGVGYCQVLREHARRWIRAALEGPPQRMRRRVRPRMMLMLSRLEMDAGRLDRALELAESAADESRYDAGFVSELVSLQLLLGRPEQARDAVARLTQPEHRRAGSEATARKLLAQVEAFERGERGPPGRGEPGIHRP